MSEVLLIEPDRVLARNLSSVLRRRGHRTVWRRDLQAAIETIDQHRPAVIIMDLATGGHGGIEFLYELRSYPEWQNLPVIICSQTAPQELTNLIKALQELDITAFHYKAKSSLADIAADVERVALKADVKKV